MSLLLRRSFANSARKLALRVQTGSSTLDEVQTMNGPMGKIWRSNLTNAVDQVEKGDPAIREYRIMGAKAHTHPWDPPNTDPWMTVQFFDGEGRRVCTMHLFPDGNFKIEESRFGRVLSGRAARDGERTGPADGGSGNNQEQGGTGNDGGSDGKA